MRQVRKIIQAAPQDAGPGLFIKVQIINGIALVELLASFEGLANSERLIVH